MKPFIVETVFDVRYAETDAMGIVHHSIYPVWYEEGRSAWFRKCLEDVRGYALFEEAGYFFAVTEVHSRYLAAARYGERIRVRTWLEALRSRGFSAAYEVYNDVTDQLLNTGRTLHLCLNGAGAVVSIPEVWHRRISR